MDNEKRKARTYKVKDSIYSKAKKKANKFGKPLANILEEVVHAVGHGQTIMVAQPDGTGVSDIVFAHS